ncbi:MAG: gluconate 5-dehydrogenase [Planctomycetaceae bacterium]|nr:gluconate 5-dehydrogenase [Planctomycetaceae bacterium]
MQLFRLDGRRALVTGASKGIGAGLARGLAEAGADLILLARGQRELEQVRDDLRATGRQIEIVTVDLLQTAEISEAYDDLVGRLAAPEILVNNAGMTRRGPAHEVTSEDWQQVLDLNLNAVFALSQAFARERIAAGEGGKIINIGSLMSHSTRPHNAPYATSKGGVLLMTKALAVDWAPHGILVNAIGPGYIQTPLNQALVDDPKFSEWVEGRCPLGRWGQPADLVGAAVFLASAASDFVTGQILYVDGGWLARF